MFLQKLNKAAVHAVSYSTASTATRLHNAKGIKRITLCDTKTRNSLSLSTMKEIIEHITSGNKDISLRCIVLQAEGPVFSSGHNLKELGGGESKAREVFQTATCLMRAIVDSPVPVISVVNGLAAAAGCQLVAQSDIALCTPNSSFSTPGASFGLFCSTPGIAVARSVNPKVALHMLLTGLPISAQEAYQCGLVSKVVLADMMENEIETITDAICSKSRAVIEVGKKFFYEQIEKDLFSAYRLGEDIMTYNLSLKDGKEGMESFIKKRKPEWKHVTQ